MKKIIYALAGGALLTAAYSTPAAAQNEGMYGVVKGIYVPEQDVGSRSYDGGAGFGLGFGKYLTPQLRAEGEISHTRADVRPDGAGALRMTSAMGNVYYDLPTGTKVKPYVGAGAGTIYGEATNDIFTDDDDFTFAYQLMAGANVEMNNGHEFVVGYRYLDGEDLNVSGGSDFDLGSHNIEVGYRMPFKM